jgi:hypothetical protein
LGEWSSRHAFLQGLAPCHFNPVWATQTEIFAHPIDKNCGIVWLVTWRVLGFSISSDAQASRVVELLFINENQRHLLATCFVVRTQLASAEPHVSLLSQLTSSFRRTMHRCRRVCDETGKKSYHTSSRITRHPDIHDSAPLLMIFDRHPTHLAYTNHFASSEIEFFIVPC